LLDEIANRPTLPDPALRGHALFLLATSRLTRGLYAEAESAALAAAETYSHSFGEWHPVLARTFHTLGVIRGKLVDYPGARSFYARAEAIERHSFGENSVQFQITESDIGWLDVQTGDLPAAERRAKSALQVLQAASLPDRRQEGFALILFGWITEAEG